jgi:polysaccharide deacetylase family protein (PEP-CTERM system associated)
MQSSRLPVSFTLDLEDHRPADAGWEPRYPEVTRRLLAHLAERGVRGSVFVVGEVAERHPDLVEEVVAHGHEVGLHAWRHVPLAVVGPEQFADEIGRGRDLLRRLTGQEVGGFRAPTYSLVRATTWAVPMLTDLGFTYSSSTLPGPNPLFGFPELPNRPFRWPTGLVEFPGPVIRLGPWAVAPIGGTYLRVLPWPVVAASLRWMSDETLRHAYCHPYDFDPDEPYWQVGDVPKVLNRLLWWGRRGMLARLDRVLAGGVGPPLGELVATVEATPIELELVHG